MRIFGVIPLFELKNNASTKVKGCKMWCRTRTLICFWVELCCFRVQCKIRMLCFVVINSFLFNLLRVWILFQKASSHSRFGFLTCFFFITMQRSQAAHPTTRPDPQRLSLANLWATFGRPVVPFLLSANGHKLTPLFVDWTQIKSSTVCRRRRCS